MLPRLCHVPYAEPGEPYPQPAVLHTECGEDDPWPDVGHARTVDPHPEPVVPYPQLAASHGWPDVLRAGTALLYRLLAAPSVLLDEPHGEPAGPCPWTDEPFVEPDEPFGWTARISRRQRSA